MFIAYQEAWMKKDLEEVKNMITKQYFKKAENIMKTKLTWKKNIIKDIKLKYLHLVSVKDNDWKDWDMFAMEINGNMIDYTIDELTWEFLESNLDRWKTKILILTSLDPCLWVDDLKSIIFSLDMIENGYYTI